MLVYHGSNMLFDKFEQRYLQNGGLYGTGAYFSTVDEVAASYGQHLYICEIPNSEYIIGDEINIGISQWKKICKKIYPIDKFGFYNYGNYTKEKLINIVSKQLTSHTFLISAIIEFNSCIYSDMSDVKEFLNGYNGIKMCNGSEVLVWDANDVKIKKRGRFLKSA